MFGQKRIICGRDHGKNFLHPPNPDYDLPYKFCLKCYKTATDAKVYICNESHGTIEESPENVAITEEDVAKSENKSNHVDSAKADDQKDKQVTPLENEPWKLEYLKNNFAGKEVEEAKQKAETVES